MESSLPDDILSAMSYEELKGQCCRILKFSDQELIEKFGQDEITKFSPDEIRKKYQFILDNVKEGDFFDLKHVHICKNIKADGNALAEERKFKEAINKYHEGIKEAQKIIEQKMAAEMIQAFRLNIAHAYNQLGEHDKAISECNKVMTCG